MKYILGWTDATLKDNYKTIEDMVKAYAEDGIVIEPEDEDREWYNFYANYSFVAPSDNEARETALSWLNNYDRMVEVFSVTNLDTDEVIMTEEDL